MIYQETEGRGFYKVHTKYALRIHQAARLIAGQSSQDQQHQILMNGRKSSSKCTESDNDLGNGSNRVVRLRKTASNMRNGGTRRSPTDYMNGKVMGGGKYGSGRVGGEQLGKAGINQLTPNRTTSTLQCR